MIKIIIHWFVVALSLLLTAQIVPGIVISDFYTALIVAIILGLVNLIIRPILLILTLPINILTLGLFTLVINGLLFWFVASFVKGFSVNGFVPALLGSLLVSLISFIASKALHI